MNYWRLLGVVTVLLLAPLLVPGESVAAAEDPAPARVNADWHKIGDLPAIDDRLNSDAPIGVHNDALFVLRHALSSDTNKESVAGTLRVAT